MMHLTKTYNLTHATLKPDPINKNHRENTHVTTTDKPTDRKARENRYEDLKHKRCQHTVEQKCNVWKTRDKHKT